MFRYHWYLLLFFCFCTSFLGHSQDEKVFIDYGACTKGLLVDGDTIIPAQFDGILKAKHSFSLNDKTQIPNYWLVHSGEEQGMFNSNYELIVPLAWHSVRLISDSIVLTASDSIGWQLHHGFNKNIKTPIFSNITYNFYHDSIFLCEKNDSTYLYDLNLHFIRSVPYKNMSSFPHLMNCAVEDTKYMYRIDSADYSGYSNIRFDVTALEKDKKITPIPVQHQQCLSNENIFFQLQDSSGWSGLCNLTGSIRLPSDFRSIDLFHLQNFPSDPDTRAFAYLRKTNSFKVQELHSGISSKSYDNIYYFEGYHIAVDSNKSYVLNTLLEPIDSITDKAYFFNSRREKHFRGPRDMYPDSIVPFDSELRRVHNNLFIASTSTPRRNEANFQIRNFQTGKTTEKQFNRIQTHADANGKLFYHAIKARSSKYSFLRNRYARRGKCTIYDPDLRIVSTYSGRLLRTLQESSVDALILENKSRKQGVLSVSGDTIVPFDFDLIQYTEMHRYAVNPIIRAEKMGNSGRSTEIPNRKNDSLFLVTRDSKQGLLNIRGETILPVRYNRINLINGTIQAFTDDSLFYYYSYDSLITSYGTPQYSQPGTFSRKMKKAKKRKKNTPPKVKVTYFEENDTYYVYSSFTDTTVKFRNSYAYGAEFIAYHKRILNRDSEIVYRTKQKSIKVYSSGSTSYFFDKNNCILLDSTGILKVEPFPKKREANISEEYISVYSKSEAKKQFSGIYDLKTLRWSFPIREGVETSIRDDSIVIRGNDAEGYQIYDLDGSLKLPFKLKYARNFHMFGDYYSVRLFEEGESNGQKMAILDRNFQYILAPSYNEVNASELGTIEVVDTNENVMLIKGSKQLSLGKVRIRYYDSSIVVLKQPDSIAFLNSDLIFEKEFTHIPELFTTHNLMSFYLFERDPKIQKLAFVYGDNISRAKRELVQNLALWPYIQKYNVHGSRYPIYSEFTPSKSVAFDTANVPTQNGRRWIGKGSYEVAFKQRSFFVFNNLVQSFEYFDSTFYLPRTVHYKKKRRKKAYSMQYVTEFNSVRIDTNYFFLTDTALIELPDFKFTETYQQEELRTLLLKKLNEAQALGLRCVNIEEEIDHLASHFQIKMDGIRFIGTRNQHAIEISYFELYGIWKNPYTVTKDIIPNESP